MRIPVVVPALILALSLLAGPARAEDLVYATGRVFAADGRTPLTGAVVAVYDSKNRVVDYSRTDERGEYTLAVPRGTLNLNGKGGKGFFRQVIGAVGGVGRVAVLPLKAGIRAAAGIANAADPITRLGIGTASGVAQGLVDQMAPPDRKRPIQERSLPGVMVMKVTVPGHNDAVSLARVYWMEEQVFRVGRKEQRALAAWVDPANMTRAGEEKPSTITSNYLTFTEARIEPSIAEKGQTVTVWAKLPAPPDPATPAVVIARHSKSGQVYQLESVGGGVYRGEITIDKKFPKHDQTLCLVAYAEQDERPGRNKKVEDAINGAGLLNPEKPYIYNPLMVVSRNRAEVTLTVVEPSKRR